MRLPRVRRVLVVAPHPDDEVIGAWGLIRRFVAAGAEVRVIVVSDGGASHPGSRTWPPSRLIRERRRETLRAMARLGVPRSRIAGLGLPDGGLTRAQRHVDHVVGRAVRRGPPAGLIVGPVTDDAHGDHRAVAYALARVRGRGERRLGYRVWPDGTAGRRRNILLRLGAQEMAAKRLSVRSYRTQMGRIADAQAGFAMTWRHLLAFVRPAECFAVLA